MRHYCTLFDSKYLPQGLVLYESLKKHSSQDFTLYALPMDDACHDTLIQMALPGMLVIDPVIFESAMKMKKVKANRTFQEYCWTCASNFSCFLMERTTRTIPEITYLDADMMFFSDPEVIFNEIGEHSIGIIPHRFIPEKKYLEVNGKFNVSWTTFRNTPTGRECLNRWAEQCRERCSEKVGCGDQLYLNEWPECYGAECHVIENIGAGLAPWNVGNYRVTEGPRVGGLPVVFHHFHEWRMRDDESICRTNYRLRDEDIRFIYDPYAEMIHSAKAQIMAARSDTEHTKSYKEGVSGYHNRIDRASNYDLQHDDQKRVR